MQLSNVPEVRPARRLLVIACALFAAAFVYNLVSVVLAFQNHDSDRWLNVARLVPNLIVPLLIWRGYVLLAALAERAAIYKQALEDGIPKLQAAVDRHRHEENEATVEARAGSPDADVRAARAGGLPPAGPPVQGSAAPALRDKGPRPPADG